MAGFIPLPRVYLGSCSTAICYSCAIITTDGSTWGWLGGCWDGARPAGRARARPGAPAGVKIGPGVSFLE
eukprot:gene20233-biopygen5564